MSDVDPRELDEETLISWIQGCAWVMTLAYERQDWGLFGAARKELDELLNVRQLFSVERALDCCRVRAIEP